MCRGRGRQVWAASAEARAFRSGTSSVSHSRTTANGEPICSAARAMAGGSNTLTGERRSAKGIRQSGICVRRLDTGAHQGETCPAAGCGRSTVLGFRSEIMGRSTSSQPIMAPKVPRPAQPSSTTVRTARETSPRRTFIVLSNIWLFMSTSADRGFSRCHIRNATCDMRDRGGKCLFIYPPHIYIIRL